MLIEGSAVRETEEYFHSQFWFKSRQIA